MDTAISHASPASEPVTTSPASKSPLNSEPSHPPTYVLPDEPVVTIEPGKSWSALNLRELWSHRGLLYFLIWRDLKVRYKQTLLGVAWVVMQPLLMTLIFTVFLGMLARVPTGGVPYPLLVYSGLLPWTFFASAVIGSSYSLVGNAHLITKVYFPRVLIPAASVGARLVDFAISFAIMIGLMLFYRMVLHYHIVLTWHFALLPALIALTTLLAFALGTLASGLNVRYRDVGVALPVLIQLGMFVSPVLYPVDPLVPAKWRTLYFLNPIAGLIDGFRVALLGGEFNYFGLAVSAGYTIVLIICAGYLFRRIEQSFADVI
jgi:lipopolysaccharide transport system permease protein